MCCYLIAPGQKGPGQLSNFDFIGNEVASTSGYLSTH